jgi:hypothetical protein
VDADLNCAIPKLKNPEGSNQYIPLAPTLTSVGGLLFKKKSFYGNLRYRFLSGQASKRRL